MAIAPIPPFPALSDRANGTYNGKAFDWASHMANTFVTEVNALAANLNSIEAGGAYAIPYRYSSNIDVIAHGGYFTFPNPGSTTTLYFDTTSAGGAAVAGMITSSLASSSVVKAQVRVVAAADPSRFFVREITSFAQGDGYITAVSNGVSGSATSIAEGEMVVVHLQRTGDKGDTGLMGIYPAAKFSDRKTASTSAGDSIAGTQTRTLNTAEYNTIAGASMSGNQITLPAGTYEVSGRVPGYAVNGHKAFFYNVSDGAPAIVGSSASSPNPSGTQTDSVFDGRITITATKVFSIRHYTETAALGSALGRAANGSGQHEVFAEITLTKIA